MKSRILQKIFDINAGICTRLDGAAENQLAQARQSAKGMKEGSLSQRAKAFFWAGSHTKLGIGAKIAQAPFAVRRNVADFLLKL
jgi:hypothetical protein